MTLPDGSDSEMFTIPWQTRPEIRASEQLLSGADYCAPRDLPAELLPVAELLAALREPAAPRETARWGEALAAFRDGVPRSAVAGPPQPVTASEPRTRVLPVVPARAGFSRARFRLSVVSGTVLAGLFGGGIAAAYTGSLPTALQNFAHHAIAAPAVRATTAAGHAGRKVGPSPAGHAASGLCTAYQHALQHGDAAERSVAFRNLVNAAGGADKVATYCAPYLHHGAATQHGRHVGPGGVPAHPVTGHHGKPATGPGSGSGGGNGSGGGKGNGNPGKSGNPAARSGSPAARSSAAAENGSAGPRSDAAAAKSGAATAKSGAAAAKSGTATAKSGTAAARNGGAAAGSGSAGGYARHDVAGQGAAGQDVAGHGKPKRS